MVVMFSLVSVGSIYLRKLLKMKNTLLIFCLVVLCGVFGCARVDLGIDVKNSDFPVAVETDHTDSGTAGGGIPATATVEIESTETESGGASDGGEASDDPETGNPDDTDSRDEGTNSGLIPATETVDPDPSETASEDIPTETPTDAVDPTDDPTDPVVPTDDPTDPVDPSDDPTEDTTPGTDTGSESPGDTELECDNDDNNDGINDLVLQPGSSECWRRCPLPMVWDGSQCEGVAKNYSNSSARNACDAIGYRLPTVQEYIGTEVDSGIMSDCEGGERQWSCNSCSDSDDCKTMFDMDTGHYWTSTRQGAGWPHRYYTVSMSSGLVDNLVSTESHGARCIQ